MGPARHGRSLHPQNGSWGSAAGMYDWPGAEIHSSAHRSSAQGPPPLLVISTRAQWLTRLLQHFLARAERFPDRSDGLNRLQATMLDVRGSLSGRSMLPVLPSPDCLDSRCWVLCPPHRSSILAMSIIGIINTIKLAGGAAI
jgi:hypothetical protein